MSGVKSWSAQIHQRSGLRIRAAVITLSFVVCVNLTSGPSLHGEKSKNNSELSGDSEFYGCNSRSIYHYPCCEKLAHHYTSATVI